MAYRDNKIKDIRLVKSMSNSPLTIDLGEEFPDIITAFAKKDPESDYSLDFTITGNGRYIHLTSEQTRDTANYDPRGTSSITVMEVLA